MGVCEGNEHVETLNNDFLLLLNVMAEMRPFLKDERLALRNGIVVLAEDRSDFVNIENKLLDAGGIMCKKIGKSTPNVLNHLIGIHEYSRFDKAEAILQFLAEEDFTPILLTCGLIPDYLDNGIVVIPIFEGKNIQVQKTIQELQNFRQYAHRQPEILQRELKLFVTSDVYMRNEGGSSLNIVLEATVAVFCAIYRSDHTEQETEKRRTQLRKVISYYVNLTEEQGEEYEVLDAIKKSVENELDANPQILISPCDEIEGEIVKALGNSDVILYDEDWYYFPEKIMRQACKPLSEIISFLSLKRELYEAGMLYCNNVTAGNYTVKRMLTNSFGYTFRARFLKIRKDFFVPLGGLGLEERKRKCIWEAQEKKNVKQV